MRILFYVEPVSFNMNIRFLSPMMNLIRCIINANRTNDVSYGVASSAALLEEYKNWLRHGGLVSLYEKELFERDILSHFGFDTAVYAQELFRPNPDIPALAQAFSDIERDFSPDLVISFTQNSWLELQSSKYRVLFAERGPLPRWNGRDNFYFDPAGHQVHSLLVERAGDIKGFGISDDAAAEVAGKFRDLHRQSPSRLDAAAAFDSWLERTTASRPVAMIANQPHDSLLVAGATCGVTLETFMMRTMAELPEDWMAFGTYHNNMGDCSLLDQRLSAQFPNYVGLPSELRQFGSDPFSEAIDAVITVGSKAALPAALLEKKVIASPKTMLGGLTNSDVRAIATAQPLSVLESGRVLAFLSNLYTIPNEALFETSCHWLDLVTSLMKSEDMAAPFLDASAWSMERFDSMFGA